MQGLRSMLEGRDYLVLTIVFPITAIFIDCISVHISEATIIKVHFMSHVRFSELQRGPSDNEGHEE